MTGPRRLAFAELVQTEEQYIGNLTLLKDAYMEPMKKASPPLLDPQDISQIFSQCVVLLGLHKAFIKVLYKKQEELQPSTCIGDIFVDSSITSQLRMYEPYINNYFRAVSLLTKRTAKSKKLAQFLRNTEAKCRKDLESLLITPVQRVPRYSLLLKELHRRTEPTHPDSKKLLEAIDAMDNVASVLNEKKRAAESREAVHAVSERLEHKCRDLVTASRRFVLEADMECVRINGKSKTVGRLSTVFLFNDAMVIARQHKSLTGKMSLKYRQMVLLDPSKVTVEEYLNRYNDLTRFGPHDLWQLTCNDPAAFVTNKAPRHSTAATSSLGVVVADTSSVQPSPTSARSTRSPTSYSSRSFYDGSYRAWSFAESDEDDEEDQGDEEDEEGGGEEEGKVKLCTLPGCTAKAMSGSLVCSEEHKPPVLPLSSPSRSSRPSQLTAPSRRRRGGGAHVLVFAMKDGQQGRDKWLAAVRAAQEAINKREQETESGKLVELAQRKEMLAAGEALSRRAATPRNASRGVDDDEDDPFGGEITRHQQLEEEEQRKKRRGRAVRKSKSGHSGPRRSKGQREDSKAKRQGKGLIEDGETGGGGEKDTLLEKVTAEQGTTTSPAGQRGRCCVFWPW